MSRYGRLYCPQCIENNIPVFSPKLSSKMVKIKDYAPFTIKCVECGSIYKDKSKLLSLMGALDKVREMAGKLDELEKELS